MTSTVDLLYSDALIRFLASKSLRKDRFYRIDRRDVRRDVLKVRTTEGQLAFCRNHVIDIHDKQPHPFPAKFNIPHLHIGAPGDFILLSRDLWSAIQGWPEFDTLGVGLDVLVCYAAHFQGARELVLPSTMHLYHIDHDSLWKSSKPSLEQAFYVRLNLKRFLPVQLRRALGRIFHRIFPVKPGYWESRGVTSLNVPGIEKMLAEMSSGTRRPVFNDATWGLVDEKFPEFRIDADLPEASVKASRPG
jgi:hypothetical protein